METYRSPLRELIGKYEAQFLNEKHARWTAAQYSRSLWNYFRKFPRKSDPRQFSLSDTADWRVWREEEGAAYSTVRKELCTVRAFFAWLVEEVPGYEDLAIPVVIPAWPQALDAEPSESLLQEA